ncbi:MAG: hypothetical protein JWM07_839 [Candidatus Saccharibacteria bacterium]|nr:hypothetical protein [Candidatus Saccharibacteria bacterium]
MSEQYTQSNEASQAHERTPEVGDHAFVERSDGRISLMEVTAISEPGNTFDSHNKPVTERLVTVVGSMPEIIDGQTAYPSKEIVESLLLPEMQSELGQKMIERLGDTETRQAEVQLKLGKLGLTVAQHNDASVNMYHIPQGRIK